MQPKLLIQQIGRYWNVDRVLKLAFLVCILLTSTSLAFSQKYFYYYNGEKQPLELNTNYVYLVIPSNVSDSNQLKVLVDENVQVTKFNLDNSAKTLKKVSQADDVSTEYWAELKLKNKLSESDYLKYLKELEKLNAIKNAAPYFKNKDGDKVGISQYINVKLRTQDDYSRLSKMATEFDAVIVGQNPFMPLWYTLKCKEDAKLNALELANKLYETGMYEHAEPSLLLEGIAQVPNDPLYNDQWGLNNTGQYGGTVGIDINAINTWNTTKGSGDVVVAVLDHGFEMNHPDLQGNTFGTGFNTGTGTSPAQVLGPHGTACAGIISAGQDNNRGVSGIAPNSKIMSISNSLLSGPTTIQELANGINWAWQNGADIISNSWGHNSLVSGLIDNAITNALTNGRGGLGTIVVFSAGNSNNAVIYPASSNPDIIAVGASDDCGLRVDPTGGSSCLSWNAFQGSCFGAPLDIMAPGAMVSTTDRQGGSGYTVTDYTDSFGGTSSACPFVAGVAALILSVNPCLTHDEVEDIIEQTAQKVGGYAYNPTVGRPNGTWNNEMGYGLIDADAAVQLAQQMLPDNGDFDIYAKDRPFDIGSEPNPDNGPMWISEDIWVRQNLDGGASHQNPEFKMFSPNGVYVKIRNKSSVTSDCANLSLYFSKASTGLVWPNHWINYSLSGVLNGDKINMVSIPPIAPGGTYTVEIPWYPPNPGDFVNDVHHFCLLARIESPADPMFSELSGVGVSGNVKKNNNIVWKNVQVYNTDISDFTSLYIRGTERGWSKIDLAFWDRGFEDKIDKPFFDRGGEIKVKVDPEFFERIKEAELQEVKIIDDNMLYIASPKARISGIPVYSKETFSMHFAFGVDVAEGEEVILDVLQQNSEKRTLEGGERFVITNARKGRFDEVSKLDVKKDNLVYPNPADDEIYLKYEVLSDDSEVEISIYNILDARQSMKLFSGKVHRGERFEKYDVHRLKKGVYILQLKVGDKVTTERVVIE